MKRRNTLPIIALALIASFGFTTMATAQQAPNGVEVLARGPVHEAFAEPAEQQPSANPIIERQPPAPIEELPPDQKPDGDNVQWIPGYWAYDDDRKDFIWISGFWRVPPPNRDWVPGNWRQVGTGYQWVGGFWSAQQNEGELDYLPQPPQPVEIAPTIPAPSVNHVYVPGCWVWRERYVWRPGFWIEHRPNWIWVPAHYTWTPAGYVFVDGYWDYPLADRGVLFAPVYVPQVVYVQPDYVYTPTYVVRDQCMYGALFVRRGYGCYYFGDYFEPRYRTVGFSAWCGPGGNGFAVTSRNYHYDPLFSYYSVAHRNDRYWSGGIQDVYVGRYNNTIARPPHTLIQQTNVINNITVNNINVNQNITNNNINVNQTNINNVTMLQNVSQVKQVGANRLSPLPIEGRQQQQASASQLKAVSVQRANVENQLVAKNPARTPNFNQANPAPAFQPQTAKLALPKRPEASRPFANNANPNVSAPALKAPPPSPVKVERPLRQPQPFSNPAPTVGQPQPKIQPQQQPLKTGLTPAPAINPLPKVNSTPRPFQNPNPAPVNNPQPKLHPAPMIGQPKPQPVQQPRPAPIQNPQPKIEQPKPLPIQNPQPRPFQNPNPAPVNNPQPKLLPAPVIGQPQPRVQPKIEQPKPQPIQNPAPRAFQNPNPAPVNNFQPKPQPIQNPAPRIGQPQPPPVKLQPPQPAPAVRQPQPAPVMKQPAPAVKQPAPGQNPKPQPKDAPRPFGKKQ